MRMAIEARPQCDISSCRHLTGLLPHPSAPGVAQGLAVVKPSHRVAVPGLPQAAKAALCLAFHMNRPIASMFKRFQAMPFRNAAAYEPVRS